MKHKPFEIYKDRRGKFRWRVRAENGRILAVSSESYTRKIDCRDGASATALILLYEEAVYNSAVYNKLIESVRGATR